MLSSTCETETRVMTVQLSQKANGFVPTELSFHLHQLPITLCADSVFQNFHSWLFEWWKFESFCSAFLWLCSNLSTATAMLPPQAHCPGHAARWTHKHWKDCRFAPYFVATFEVLLVQLANCNHRHKLQALVHNSLPSTTAIFSYAIGSRKLSPNEQFFAGAHSQITSDICSITAPVAYASSNETKTVWIETELFFTRGGCASCLWACLGARLLLQSY